MRFPSCVLLLGSFKMQFAVVDRLYKLCSVLRKGGDSNELVYYPKVAHSIP